MLNGYGLAALGRDMELRETPTGRMLGSMSLAFTLSTKGPDGKRATQWVDATLWGARAESLAEYMLRGTKVCVSLSNLRIEEYEHGGQRRAKLCADVADIAFAGGRAEDAPKPAPKPAPPKPAAKQATGFDDMDDDVPF